MFFARAGGSSTPSYFAAAGLVFAICTGVYVLTLPLVRLLPNH